MIVDIWDDVYVDPRVVEGLVVYSEREVVANREIEMFNATVVLRCGRSLIHSYATLSEAQAAVKGAAVILKDAIERYG